MPDEIYIVMEHRFGGEIYMTPYLSEESAKQHYEETLAVYTDPRRPFWPLVENPERNHFVYKKNNAPYFECGYTKEELYA